MTHLRIAPVALSGTVIAATMMLLLSILALMGVYEGAADMMIQWHQFYDLTVFGVVAGMLEAAAITFVALASFVWVYNKIQARMG